MMRDSTARSQAVGSYVAGYNKGVAEASKVLKKNIRELVERLKWRCTKHDECGDFNNFCDRRTDTPCQFRVLNPNYEKAIKEL